MKFIINRVPTILNQVTFHRTTKERGRIFTEVDTGIIKTLQRLDGLHDILVYHLIINVNVCLLFRQAVELINDKLIKFLSMGISLAERVNDTHCTIVVTNPLFTSIKNLTFVLIKLSHEIVLHTFSRRHVGTIARCTTTLCIFP